MIFITGGLGFIGSNLALHFKGEGYEVAVIDNRRDDVGNHRTSILAENGIRCIHKEYIGWINGLMGKEMGRDIDTILHCAAQTAVTRSLKNPRYDFINNARGTFELCEYARENDSGIIYMSTNKVYGDNVNKIPIEETSTRYEFIDKTFSIGEDFPIDRCIHSPYGVSKLVGDLYVQDYEKIYGLNNKVFRCSCIYGADQSGTEDQGWIYHLGNLIIGGGTVKIFGDGKQVRDILYIDDLVNLFDKAIESEERGVFNIGGGFKNTISVLELIKLFNKEFKNIKYHNWRLADQKIYISNIQKAREAFDWEPTILVEEGIKRLKAFFNLKYNSVKVK